MVETIEQEQELRSQYTPVTTRAQFVEIAVGHQWQSDEIRATFGEDGAISGGINGVPLTGTWKWDGSQFCMTFRVATSGGNGCSKLGYKPGEILVTPLHGFGAPYAYTRVN
ncbi:hypothetical protein FPZ52_07205 [Qingshengfaniella alkalisoli]|uniref:Uncharacterized protein n=2 Tax=Qingshengfaniella alkalisoli TaxID=2599296 RepID=A0A5B8IV04_9RHOB|nr:hypothetical protein FPZ52_07205 [Qingshengfaniella alkalisoli]